VEKVLNAITKSVFWAFFVALCHLALTGIRPPWSEIAWFQDLDGTHVITVRVSRPTKNGWELVLRNEEAIDAVELMVAVKGARSVETDLGGQRIPLINDGVMPTGESRFIQPPRTARGRSKKPDLSKGTEFRIETFLAGHECFEPWFKLQAKELRQTDSDLIRTARIVRILAGLFSLVFLVLAAWPQFGRPRRRRRGRP
jgi:hypothetical protein